MQNTSSKKKKNTPKEKTVWRQQIVGLTFEDEDVK